MGNRPPMTSAQFAEQFQFAREMMADWPEWKRNILVHSLSPTSKRRTPVTAHPTARIPCGKKLWNRDFEPAGKCGETYHRPGMPSHCDFCSDCTRELASLGVKVLNFRRAYHQMDGDTFPANDLKELDGKVLSKLNRILRECGVIEL